MLLTQAILNLLSISAVFVKALPQTEPGDVQGWHSFNNTNKKARVC